MKQDKASSTALTVLQGVLYTAQTPQYANLVSEEMQDACMRILSASPEGRKRLRLLQNRWLTMAVPFLEWLMLPGISLHYQ